MFGDHRQPIRNQRWIEFRNDSGEEIPAFGVLKITGSVTIARGRYGLTAIKPSSATVNVFALNGRKAVPAGGANASYGMCTLDWPAFAAYDTNDGVPGIGTVWGPKSGQLTMAKGNPGFAIAGTAGSSAVWVISDPAKSEFGRIEGTTVGAVAGGATFTIDNVKVIAGANPLADPTSTTEAITVQNRFSEHSNDNALCFAEYNKDRGYWQNYFLDSICPP